MSEPNSSPTARLVSRVLEAMTRFFKNGWVKIVTAGLTVALIQNLVTGVPLAALPHLLSPATTSSPTGVITPIPSVTPSPSPSSTPSPSPMAEAAAPTLSSAQLGAVQLKPQDVSSLAPPAFYSSHHEQQLGQLLDPTNLLVCDRSGVVALPAQPTAGLQDYEYYADGYYSNLEREFGGAAWQFDSASTALAAFNLIDDSASTCTGYASRSLDGQKSFTVAGPGMGINGTHRERTIVQYGSVIVQVVVDTDQGNYDSIAQSLATTVLARVIALLPGA